MKNFVQPGCTLTVAAPYDVTSGAGVQVGDIFGIAALTALSGADVQIDIEGVFDVAKVSAQAWSVGQTVYWDNSAKLFTTVQSGNMRVGKAVKVATNPSATGRVQLLGEAVGGGIASVGFAVAAGGTNVTEVTISPRDAAGNLIPGVRGLEVWLADDAAGTTLTATTASGAVANKASEGTVLTALTAKKHLSVLTKAAGTFVLSITDTAKTGFYVAVKNPATGLVHVSSQLVTANYG